MKKILGLDLGVGSVGWSAIEIDYDNNARRLLGMGSRIVPLTVDETTGFTKGKGESVCHARTMKRSMRRNLDRFQQRRKRIGIVLGNLGMKFADDLLKLSPMELWSLRASAAEGRKLTLSEIGRVVFHINSRRGYRSSKEEAAGDKKQSDYLAAIGARAKEADGKGQTPGQYFAERLKQSETITAGGKVYSYRIKEKVFPRKAYEKELHTILKAQQAHYPDILTDENIAEIEDAVFYQRPLKSCKHLVSLCEFESREITDSDGKKHLVGPRVAPVSSPLFQVERLWEAVNNIVLVNSRNRRRKNADIALSLFGDARKEAYEYRLTHDERLRVFEFLNTHAQMKGSDLLKILGLKKDDGFAVPANIARHERQHYPCGNRKSPCRYAWG